MSKTLEIARMVLETEAQAILRLIDSLDERFEGAVDLIYACPGKVLVSGMGKSGLICRKIASTFSSLGIISQFLHPGEAIHGDIGIVRREDVVVVLSNSGETVELLRLIELLKRKGVSVIALTGAAESTLARISDVALDAGAPKEACPHGLVPTASTTSALAMGDALAMALAARRGFGRDDYASNHPGGSLGQRILRVKDVMHTGDEIPVVEETSTMRTAVEEITNKGFGMTVVVDDRMNMKGIIVDGDIRRLLRKDGSFLEKNAGECCNRDPKIVHMDELASTALLLMQENKITSLVATEGGGSLAGVLHIHDLWRLGLP